MEISNEFVKRAHTLADKIYAATNPADSFAEFSESEIEKIKKTAYEALTNTELNSKDKEALFMRFCYDKYKKLLSNKSVAFALNELLQQFSRDVKECT